MEVGIKNSKKPNTDDILNTVKDNDGFYPCKTIKNDDIKCICKEFINQVYIGECHCGLYEKVEVE